MIVWVDPDHSRAATVWRRWSAERCSNTIWCRTAAEAISILAEYEIDEAHIEHDLDSCDSRSELSGMEIVRWLERLTDKSRFSDTKFVIHSHAPAGATMVDRLRKVDLNAYLIPFGHSS
jgi:hypothetical protein